MLVAMLACTFMVLLTVILHYEGLLLITRVMVRISLAGRRAIIVSVTALFALHTVEVWLYAIAYAALGQLEGPQFSGEFSGTLEDYLYFSATSYTSLGLGDVYPRGAMRLLTGVEALNGLVLIGWSASYSYLLMQRMWGYPGDSATRWPVD